ncbi:MAG TPA: D-alanyl-D-alanine carboxypeptidase/D-alanyl-D-alanine-endopeptidase [Pyrinomonadaceae bacterium]|nr:D-alanyl-D-alanine carboxypeptidase/D-alanyl-D-alanine-endopeptidase [Pyrinomonadaceae bacterium]
MTKKNPARRTPRLILSAILLLTFVVAARTWAIRKLEGQTDSASAGTPSGPNSATAVAGPYDSELTRLIDQAIDTSDFSSARWGVSVISLRDGRVLYARNADKLFTPASNMKIYTTAVALDLLGPEYQWRTSVYANSQPDASGLLKGDLTLYGRGAPDLSSQPKKDSRASLVQLAEDLYSRGVRRIGGNVIGDESYFRAEQFGNGWQWNDLQWYFGAEPSALSINGNQVDLQIKPANKTGEPALVKLSSAPDYVHLSNETTTVKHGEQMTIGINRGLTSNELKVWGEFPLGAREYGAHLSVHDPALWAARLLIAALKTRGIAVDGEARARDFRVPQTARFDSTRAIELANVLSRPLSEIVRATNKESINLNAELILRTMGRERGEVTSASETHKTHERGDDEAGVALVRQWLDRAGVKTDNLALHDGSGLSRLDLVTPDATAHLLLAISKAPSASVFRDSLPLAGSDGTLAGRLRLYKDRISAKTGSLVYDNSLSGFVSTAGGDILAFSLMCNDQTSHASSIRTIDEIAGILAEYGSPKARKP